MGKLLETVALVSQSVNPDLRVTAILLCMHERQTTLAREVVADLDEFFEGARDQKVPWRDCRVFRPFVRRNVKVAEAPSYGQTVFDYAPWCAGANDYRRIAEQVIKNDAIAPAPDRPGPAQDPEAPQEPSPRTVGVPAKAPPASDTTVEPKPLAAVAVPARAPAPEPAAAADDGA